jgi:predicted RNase H-like nuclease (RuvC/YqgF family)
MATQPYVLAACISAIPTSIMAISTWYGVHKGRKENSTDNGKVAGKVDKLVDEVKDLGKDVRMLDTKVQKLDLRVERMDLRFDAIQDTLDRHLGWHREQALSDLPEALSEERSENERHRHPTAND